MKNSFKIKCKVFKHGVNETSRDRVNRASSACVACPDGSPLRHDNCSDLVSGLVSIFLINNLFLSVLQKMQILFPSSLFYIFIIYLFMYLFIYAHIYFNHSTMTQWHYFCGCHCLLHHVMDSIGYNGLVHKNYMSTLSESCV